MTSQNRVKPWAYLEILYISDAFTLKSKTSGSTIVVKRCFPKSFQPSEDGSFFPRLKTEEIAWVKAEKEMCFSFYLALEVFAFYYFTVMTWLKVLFLNRCSLSSSLFLCWRPSWRFWVSFIEPLHSFTSWLLMRLIQVSAVTRAGLI